MPIDISWGDVLTGAALWQGIRFVLDPLIKRVGQRGETQRAEARAALSEVLGRATDVIGAAQDFYPNCASEQAGALRRKLLHAVRLLGMDFNRANHALVAANRPELDPQLLISYRQAVTMPIDLKVPLPESCAEVVAMYQAHNELTKAVYVMKVETA